MPMEQPGRVARMAAALCLWLVCTAACGCGSNGKLAGDRTVDGGRGDGLAKDATPRPFDGGGHDGGAGDGGGGARVLRNLQYGKWNEGGVDRPLLLDLHFPAGQPQQAWPLVVYIHGGGWIEGTKDVCPCATLAAYGYVVASIDYRLSNQACPAERIFPAQIHDVKAAVRWLRLRAGEYQLDPNRVAAIGDSSGGHLAALLGTSSGVAGLEGDQNLGPSDRVQGVCDWYGPVDIRKGPVIFDDDPCHTSLDELVQKYGGESTPFFYWTWAWGQFLGGSLRDPVVLARAERASPTTHIDPSDPPFLVIHGKRDGMVPVGQSEILVRALADAGVSAVFVSPENMDHSWMDPSGAVDPRVLGPTLEFLREHL